MLLTILHSLVSYVLTVVMALSAVGAAAENSGEDAWDEEVYTEVFEKQALVQRIFSLGIRPPANMKITMDDTMQGMFDSIQDSTGYDFERMLQDFPDLYYYIRWVYRLLPNQFNAWRDDLIAKGDQYEIDGDGARKGRYRMVGSMLAMPVEAKLMAVEDGGSDYEIHVEFIYADGSKAILDTSARYNPDTGFIGEYWSGIAGIGYNFVAGSDRMWAYTVADPFQRALGYMKLYDTMLLQTTDMVDVETVRLKFEYEEKEWMLQLWKGRYFITNAGEVGLYHRPLSRLVEFYDAVPDEDRVPMSFKLTTVDDDFPLVDRGQETHWWMTGFALNRQIYLSDKLSLYTDVTAPTEEFRDALVASIKVQQKDHKDLVYDVDGLTIKIAWGPDTLAE